MNAVITLGNQPIDILNPNFARVSQLQRASRLEAAGNNAKHNRVEDRLVLFIERTVDENTSARRRWHPAQLCLTTKKTSLSEPDRILALYFFGSVRFNSAIFRTASLITLLETVPLRCTSGIGRYFVSGTP